MSSNAQWLDGDGYPTDAALAKIKEWPYQDANGCLDFVASLWRYREQGVSDELREQEKLVVYAEPGDKFLRLATIGWSGNEDLICALDENRMVTMMTWQMSTRGGLHIYERPHEQQQSFTNPEILGES